jgi:carboxyl-terminal processing protease
MLSRVLLLGSIVLALVGCSTEKQNSTYQTIPVDTPVHFVDSKGNVVETVQPEGAEVVPAPTEFDLIKDAWTQIGFSKELLMDDLIGVDVCSLSEKQFVGCFFVAQDMSTKVYGEDTVLYVSNAKSNDMIGAPVAVLGLYTVYKKVEQAPIDRNDPHSVSEYLKRNNDFFKETVRQIVALYKSQIESEPTAVAARTIIQKDFPDVVAKMNAAAALGSTEIYEINRLALKETLKSLGTVKAKLAASMYKEYMELANAAFEKIPESDRAYMASEYYGLYMRRSADGHARIELHPTIQKIIKDKVGSATAYGIGVSIKGTDDGIFMEPLENSAAIAAGIELNDKVVSVDGAVPKDLDDAVSKIKGPINTTVQITVERWGTKEQKTLTINRQPLRSSSYTFSIKTVGEKSYGMLQVATFSDEAMANAVRAYIQENDSKVDGWILDLRNNGGGYVTQAVDLLSAFLPKGSKTVIQSREDNPDIMDENSTEITRLAQVTTKNLVVLVNEGSASASEITSGILQETQRALVVGVRTYGKGSVQQAPYPSHVDIPDYQVWLPFKAIVPSGLGSQEVPAVMAWKTMGRYFFPSGRTPEWQGVQPDITMTPNPEIEELFSPREQDNIPFSFGALGEPWKQTRPDFVGKVEECVKTAGSQIKLWSPEDAKKPFAADYQTLYAYDAVSCM